MRREVNLPQDMVSRIFPRLDELLDIHRTFLQVKMLNRQRDKPDKSIDNIGDVLESQVLTNAFVDLKNITGGGEKDYKIYFLHWYAM